MPAKLKMGFLPPVDFGEWVEIGRRVGVHANASLWWLGDWLVYGKENFGRRYKHGIAHTGLEYKTLRNYAVVARCFEASRRRDTLSFQHHAEVCALSREEQDLWLDRAEAEAWTRNELRRRISCRLIRAAPHVGERRPCAARASSRRGSSAHSTRPQTGCSPASSGLARPTPDARRKE